MIATVSHPLDWWASGGYELVCREYGRAEPDVDWSYPHARRRAYKRVHAAIKQMYRLTGDSRWNPQGDQGHERLRQQILKLDLWNHDLQ
jgi:hypothetical protein